MADNFPKEYRIHFAYGADINPAQIKEKTSNPEFLGIARLDNFRLSFHGYAPMWDSSQETISPCEGKYVLGALYKLSISDGLRLDTYMDARLDGAGAFFHYPVMVKDEKGNTIHALVYRKYIVEREIPPSTEYMSLIISGAKERGIAEEYIKGLNAINTVPAKYPVPKGKSNLRAECSGCD